MGLMAQIRNHVLIGGHSAIAGWGLMVFLLTSVATSGGHLKTGVDLDVFISVLVAAALIVNGIYALNAYHDRESDRINRPERPIPSGRMTPEHALKYAVTLMTLGWFLSLSVSVFTRRYLTVILWSAFTLLGIAYSMPPLKLKARHIFGNLCLAISIFLAVYMGSVTFGVSTSTPEEAFTLQKFVTGFFVITGIITVKDFHDYKGDKARGDITLPVKFGKRRAAAISMAIIGAPIAVKLVTDIMNRASLYRMIAPATWLHVMFLSVFGVYLVLDYYSARTHKGAFILDLYSVTQWYLITFLIAYFLLRVPLLGLSYREYPWEILLSCLFYASITFISICKGIRAAGSHPQRGTDQVEALC